MKGVSPLRKTIYEDKNYIINGNFDYWQRGTTFPNPSGVYMADRWMCNNGGGNDLQVLRSTTVPNHLGKWSLRLEVHTSTGPTSAFTHLRTKLEASVWRPLLGKVVTLGFWAKLDAGLIGTGQQNLAYIENSGGNVSVELENTTDWQYVTVGRTLPTSLTELNILIQVTRDGVAIGQGINIAQVQLLEGARTLDGSEYFYAGRNLSEELSLCQRYYCKMMPSSFPSVGAYLSINAHIGVYPSWGSLGTFRFPVTMRAAPSVLTYSEKGNIGRLSSYHDVEYADLSCAVSYTTVGGFKVANKSGLSITVSYSTGLFFYTADAEL